MLVPRGVKLQVPAVTRSAEIIGGCLSLSELNSLPIGFARDRSVAVASGGSRRAVASEPDLFRG